MKYIQKDTGFVLILVMLLISGITLLVVGVSTLVYSSRALLSTLSQKNSFYNKFQTATALVECLLYAALRPCKKHSTHSENSTVKTDEKEIFAQSFEKIQHFLDLFYKWHEYEFTKERDGFSLKISFYITPESGKIPLKKILEKMKENERKSSPQDTSSDSEKNPNDSSPHQQTTDMKKIDELVIHLQEITFKKEEIQKNSLKNLFTSYNKRNEPFFASSLYDIYNTKELSSKIYSTLKEQKDITIGSLQTVLDNDLMVWYLSPAVLELLGAKRFYEFSKENKKKIQDAMKKYEQNNELEKADPKEVINTLYKNTFSLDDDKVSNCLWLIKSDHIPRYISAIIIIEEENFLQSMYAIFEKSSVSGKSSSDYIFKQLYFL